MRASDKEKLFDLTGFKKGKDEEHDSMHDEIVMWLYNKATSEGIGMLGLLTVDTFCNEHKENKSGIRIKRKIEHPLKTTVRTYRDTVEKIVGYVDLLIHIESDVEKLADKDRPTNYIETHDQNLLIEVKTKINLGETIRQINYYKSFYAHYENISWVVCAPGTTYKDVLIEQGIEYIEYKP